MADTTNNSQDELGFLQGLVQDNPLVIGLVALILGALIGLLLPETSRENELLGPKRDELAQQAQSKVKELTQKATVIAKTAQGAAQDALGKVQDAGLDAVHEAVDAVKEEAQHQGLPVGASS